MPDSLPESVNCCHAVVFREVRGGGVWWPCGTEELKFVVVPLVGLVYDVETQAKRNAK